MKIAGIVACCVALMLMSVQIISSLRTKTELQNELQILNADVIRLRDDETALQADLHYFAFPENLEKEIRQRVNYRNPDEKLLIIVPQENQNTSTDNLSDEVIEE